MSASTDPPIFIACPQCKAKLKAPASKVGTRIDCPKCNAKVLVPGVVPSSSTQTDQEEWFPLESSKGNSPEPKGTQQASPPSVFDDDLPDLAPMTQASEGRKGGQAEQALRDALGTTEDLFEAPTENQTTTTPKNAASKSKQVQIDAEAPQASTPKKGASRKYSVSCTVCKTMLTVRDSDAGTKVKCPDCFSMIVVPPPPVNKPADQARLDELDASMQLAPVEGNNPRIVSGASVDTKGILNKASKELERERQEIEAVRGAFDSKEWLSRTFGFLSDTRLIVALVLLGLPFALVYYYFQAFTPHSTQTQLSRIVHRFREDLLLTLAFPIQILLFICAVAVIPKAANRVKRIDPWPFFNHLKDYFAAACAAFAVFLITNILANLIGGIGSAVKIPVLLQDAFAEMLQWASLPILYLSMLETQNHLKPFSMSIIKSISLKPDAWGAMYMQTAIGWVLFFVCAQIGILNGPGWSAFAGLLFPWFICFVANQYGVLAGRLSDVTELGYEGVFTENE